MGVIWTNHLYERIKQRGLDPSWVDQAVRFPDTVVRSTTDDSFKHNKSIGGYLITAAVKRQGNDWVIKSAWWNEDRAQHTHKKSNSFFLERWIFSLLTKLEKAIRGRH